jgi:hypothetical protein
VEPIDVPTVFRDLDDYWSPFLGGRGRRLVVSARSTTNTVLR